MMGDEGMKEMTEYRVCLDCDRKVAPEGDMHHKVMYNGKLIGCEGYIHKDGEGDIQLAGSALEKLAEAVWYAKELEKRLKSIQKDHRDNGDQQWDGNEDYCDAVDMVAELFKEAAGQMEVTAYKAADAVSLDLVTKQWLRDREKAEEARRNLYQYWGIGPASIDDI